VLRQFKRVHRDAVVNTCSRLSLLSIAINRVAHLNCEARHPASGVTKCGFVKTDQIPFRDTDSSTDLRELRFEVRDFLDNERQSGSFEPTCNAWLEAHDPVFSRKLGERGWLGMTWPKRYGGGEQSGMARFVVIEELLAAGAPVAATGSLRGRLVPHCCDLAATNNGQSSFPYRSWRVLLRHWDE